MKSRTSVLRRMTICVAASALVSAMIGFGSPAADARTKSTPTWAKAIAALAVPGQGCFTASSPTIQWRSTACSHVHPKVPQQFDGTEPSQEDAGGGAQQVGGCNNNSCDYAAETLVDYGIGIPCPKPFSLPDTTGDCYDETENTATVPQLTPQQLLSDSVTFSGEVGLVQGVLTDTVVMTVSGASYAATAPDSLVNLSGNWKIAQFGLYGDRGGSVDRI
jgi:hypothetical protein